MSEFLSSPVDTEDIIKNIQIIARNLYKGYKLEHSVSPRRGRWHVKLVAYKIVKHPALTNGERKVHAKHKYEGDSLNQALLRLMSHLLTQAFPADMEESEDDAS